MNTDYCEIIFPRRWGRIRRLSWGLNHRRVFDAAMVRNCCIIGGTVLWLFILCPAKKIGKVYNYETDK